MIDVNKIPKKNADIVERRIKDECILVPICRHVADLNSIYTLDEVGVFIWDRIDEKNCIAEIACDVENTFEVPGQQAQEDVSQFLDELSKEGIVIF